MKRGLLVLMCAGMMLTGCTGQRFGGQEEPEIYSIDLGGNVREEGGGQNQAETTVETVPSEEVADRQEAEAGHTSMDGNDSMQDNETEPASQESQNRENAQDLYARFLNNEVSVTVGNEYPENEYRMKNLERGVVYTFEGLQQYVNQYYFDPEYDERTTYDYAQYTYVECPDSDSENLLVKFVGLNIYVPGDDSFVVYVIMEKDGQLYLTDEYASWARSYTEQYRNGLCSTFGASGAEDHYSGMSAILSDGIETYIWDAEILSGWWTSYVNEEIYREVFGENMDAPLNVSIYTVGEENYYQYELLECSEDQKKLCDTYIDRCRDEAGVNWVTDEQIQEAVKRRCSSIGVRYDLLEQKETAEWTTMINKTVSLS